MLKPVLFSDLFFFTTPLCHWWYCMRFKVFTSSACFILSMHIPNMLGKVDKCPCNKGDVDSQLYRTSKFTSGQGKNVASESSGYSYRHCYLIPWMADRSMHSKKPAQLKLEESKWLSSREGAIPPYLTGVSWGSILPPPPESQGLPGSWGSQSGSSGDPH